MHSDSRNNRHATVQKYLKYTCDNKLLKGNAADAIQYAKKAYEEASREPVLANPDPQLAAYRLGHLLMRNPKPDRNTIEEIIGLLRFATEAPELGPLPKIYLIAALNRRISRCESENDRTTSKLEMEDFFEQAVKELRRTSFRSDKTESAVIQDYTFNMLELAAYMADLPYEKLEGLGIRNDWLFEDEPCVLIEANIGPEKLTRFYAKPIAVGAFKNNAPKVPCVGLQFTKEDICIGLYENGKMKKTARNEDQVQALALLLFHGDKKTSEFEGLFGNDRNRSQGKTRINKAIRRILGNTDLEAIEQIGNIWRLSAQVPVWAIIEKSQLKHW
jgi:hypothetical protein